MLRINKPILVREITSTYSVAAGVSYYTNLKPLIDADLPSGYKCAGIVGYALNSAYCHIANLRYASGTYTIQIGNRSTSAQNNCNLYITYLAIPEEMTI